MTYPYFADEHERVRKDRLWKDNRREMRDLLLSLDEEREDRNISRHRFSRLAGKAPGWAEGLHGNGATPSDLADYATALDIRITITLEEA